MSQIFLNILLFFRFYICCFSVKDDELHIYMKEREKSYPIQRKKHNSLKTRSKHIFLFLSIFLVYTAGDFLFKCKKNNI